MPAWVLFSGGKDSSLAAYMLSQMFDVMLVTVSFGYSDGATAARETAEVLGLPHRLLSLDDGVLMEAAERCVKDGFPRYALNMIHLTAIETLAIHADRHIRDRKDSNTQKRVVLADGTRREDRAPLLSKREISSVEARHNIHYVRPLMGYGSGLVREMAENLFVYIEAPSEELFKGDYESELRLAIAEEWGEETVKKVFPHHTQSRVTEIRHS
ncbi:MAG: DUF7411 family protein [Methermicoccaceae archaeon]